VTGMTYSVSNSAIASVTGGGLAVSSGTVNSQATHEAALGMSTVRVALAHEAATTAAREGRFWNFAAFILNHQGALRQEDLLPHVGRLGLAEAKFAAALKEHHYLPRVDADVMAGQKLGVRGSPAMVIHDKWIDGVPNESKLVELIDAALAGTQAPAKASGGGR
jgi:predicted DsbA family dithiol-disulfide isomerase